MTAKQVHSYVDGVRALGDQSWMLYQIMIHEGLEHELAQLCIDVFNACVLYANKLERYAMALEATG